MTKDITAELILDVVGKNQIPLTLKEIKQGLKSLKTIGKIVPIKQNIINEYKLIQQKKSNLSKSQREGIEMRINFLLKQGVIIPNDLEIKQ